MTEILRFSFVLNACSQHLHSLVAPSCLDFSFVSFKFFCPYRNIHILAHLRDAFPFFLTISHTGTTLVLVLSLCVVSFFFFFGLYQLLRVLSNTVSFVRFVLQICTKLTAAWIYQHCKVSKFLFHCALSLAEKRANILNYFFFGHWYRLPHCFVGETFSWCGMDDRDALVIQFSIPGCSSS